MEDKKDFADMMIWLAECINEYEKLPVEWRVLKKYCDDFLLDNNLLLEIDLANDEE